MITQEDLENKFNKVELIVEKINVEPTSMQEMGVGRYFAEFGSIKGRNEVLELFRKELNIRNIGG